MKKIIFSLSILILLACLTGCAKKPGNTTAISGTDDPGARVADAEQAAPKGDVGNDTCKEFSADLIYSITGKPVVRVEPDWIMPKLACRYYFSYDPDLNPDMTNPILRAGGPHIFMMLENLNVERQKKGLEILGASTKTDARIKMEHMIALRTDGTIRDIMLIINPDRYVRMDYSKKALTDEELISFAAKIAEKIQGDLSFDIRSNPNDAVIVEPKSADTGASQQAVATTFLDKLGSKNIDEALKMMDANNDTKQMWGVNFNTIESLQVKNVTEAFKEEWTPTRQTFKYELDVKVKPAGLEMGWEQGKNFRWITLEKNNSGEWLIHEIANNP